MISAVTLGLALAFEPAEPDIMRRPPRRPGEGILTGYMAWRILSVTVLLTIPAFGLFLWLESTGASIAEARTIAVNTLVVGEIFYLWNARAIMNPVLSLKGIFGSRPVLISMALCLLLQLASPTCPSCTACSAPPPIHWDDWAILAGIGTAVFVIIELEKAVARRLRQPNPPDSRNNSACGQWKLWYSLQMSNRPAKSNSPKRFMWSHMAMVGLSASPMELGRATSTKLSPKR